MGPFTKNDKANVELETLKRLGYMPVSLRRLSN
jgi:hypothetical protein